MTLATSKSTDFVLSIFILPIRRTLRNHGIFSQFHHRPPDGCGEQ